MRTALITGVAGPRLTAAEAAFLRASRPAGLILFARNCESPDQLRRLVAETKAAAGSEALLVAIDQEGDHLVHPPDFFRVGLPLTVVIFLLALLLVPLVWPL